MIEKDNFKKCIYCDKSKLLGEFAVHKSTRDGRAHKCKSCHAEYIKNRRLNSDIIKKEKEAARKSEWYFNNKERIAKNFIENYQELTEDGITKLRKQVIEKFGITGKQYLEMFNKQHGCCAICGKPEESKRNGKIKNLAIDHDHITGEVRQLLCQTCNNGLGCFKDNIKLMKEAVKYLEKHKRMEEE